MSDSGDLHHLEHPHVALFPSAGMGHLIPFLRFAAMLLRHRCRVTLITADPTVSDAESEFNSRFLAAFPQVTHKLFRLLPFDRSTANSGDPFWLRFEAIRRSSHLLSPLLSSLSPPLSAIVSDISLISSVLPVKESLHLPLYTLFPSCARMFCLFAHFPAAQISDVLEIPGISPMPKFSIPPLLLDPNSLFTAIFLEDGKKATKLDGVFLNTFKEVEGEAIDALNGGKIAKGLPSVIPIGPFVPCEFEAGENDTAIKLWLDKQPPKSVVYLSFGSRTAASKDQIKEIGDGLVKSGFKFIWVVKTKILDKEDKNLCLGELLGEEVMKRVKERGLVVTEWVNQEMILSHGSVGGFVNHCGWNSVVEAAWHGVPMLAWAVNGDQKVNAEVVERTGMGWWERRWTGGLVAAEEIGERIREMMESEELREKVAEIRAMGRKVAEDGGRCERKLMGVIEEWKKKKKRVEASF